jgi:predicted small lipoprotein YifL
MNTPASRLVHANRYDTAVNMDVPVLNRRRFTLTLLASGAALALAACGRRGPLEPPPYTAQGQEFARRQSQNRQNQQGQGQQSQGQQIQAQQGSVKEAVENEAAQRGTVDVESQIEGTARAPSDPTAVGQQQQNQSLSPTSGRRRPPGIKPPDQPFILDGLLK